jgi:hypothetical protein
MIRLSGGSEPAGGMAAVRCLQCAEAMEGILTVGVHVTHTFCL